jgi:hypothetical protein
MARLTDFHRQQARTAHRWSSPGASTTLRQELTPHVTPVFSEKNQVPTYMHAKIKFHAYSGHK